MAGWNHEVNWRSLIGISHRALHLGCELVKRLTTYSPFRHDLVIAAAINGERPYPITPEEIIHGVAVLEAIVRSAALHQPVEIANQ